MTGVKQGDSYYLPIYIEFDSGSLDLNAVECVEFCLGDVRKLYPEEVDYEEDTNEFHLKLTQKETFTWPYGAVIPLDIRVKFKSGDVIGIPKPIGIRVNQSLSKVVL